jgi:3-oxoacyl-[acyl-carrier-protein] synthase III
MNLRNAIIYSTGSYLPETVVFNEELTQFPDTSIVRIAQKTGVLSRRIASEDQCTSDLGIAAALNCLEKVNFPIEQLEGIVVSTSSPDRVQPPTATRIQGALGARDAFAFDINSVCSGSIYGISMVDSLITSGKYDNILFIAAEMYSRILNPQDFGTLPYFGDGAGAILFQAGDSNRGVAHSCLGTDGHLCETVGVPGGGSMIPFEKMSSSRLAYLRMNGRAIKEFAMHRGPEVVIKLAEQAGISLDDVDCCICHQANINIIHEISSKVGIPLEKFYINLYHYGNTASASVLIALDEAISKGVIHQGDLVLMVSFGGGLSWGATLVRI